LVVMVVVTVVVLQQHNSPAESTKHNGTSTETTASVAMAREEEIRQLGVQTRISQALEGGASVSQTSVSGSPYARAMEWILYDDPMQLGFTDDNLLQRYALSLFYFSTILNEEEEWKECNPPPPLPTDDAANGDNGRSQLCYYQELLSSVHLGLLGGGFSDAHGINYHGNQYVLYNEAVAHRWLSGAHECMWAGLFCEEPKKVTHIRLENMTLTGTIPPELSMVEDLRSIDLQYNDLFGPIPSSISFLTNLTYIDLQVRKAKYDL